MRNSPAPNPEPPRQKHLLPLWLRCIAYVGAVILFWPVGLYLMYRDEEFTWGVFLITLIVFVVVVLALGFGLQLAGYVPAAPRR